MNDRLKLRLIDLCSKPHGYTNIKAIDWFVELSLKILIFVLYAGSWKKYREAYSQSYSEFEPSQKFYEEPNRFLIGMAIVLKPYNSPIDKGLILVAYNYAFPTMDYMFDMDKVLDRYELVLEPSTARMCMPDILMFKGFEQRIFVEAGEPRDFNFVQRYVPNAVPIPVAANWWIDSRIFKPNKDTVKDIDLIMVASWLRLKRHELLFQALAKLKSRGKVLSCALVGYPIDMTKEEVVALARQYGVFDQIEIYEWLSQEEIAVLYQRSKLNLLLSKKEGTNRSVIEGLYCDVPFMLMKGFNFGDPYDYLNEKTGAYYSDETLDMDIESALANLSKFEPSSWVVENSMSAEGASKLISETVFGDPELMVKKVSGLDGMEYWEEVERQRFDLDYDYLNSCIKINIGK